MRPVSRCLESCGRHYGFSQSSRFRSPKRCFLGSIESLCTSGDHSVENRRVQSVETGRSLIGFIGMLIARYLHKGNALFSTSAGDMSTKPAGGAGKQPKSDVAKKESPDEQIADMKILLTLAKYLWLKDNVEFRFRVVMALGLLVGAKIAMVSGILAYKFGPTFVWITSLSVAAYVALTLIVTQWRTKFRQAMNKADNDASTRVIDSLLDYETVKYFNNEAFEVAKYDSFLNRGLLFVRVRGCCIENSKSPCLLELWPECYI